MEIQAYGTSTQYAQMQAQLTKVEEKTASEKNTEDAAAKKAVEKNEDKFVKSAQADSGVYTKNKLNQKQVSQLMADAENRVQSFQKMLESMLVKQGQKSNVAMFGRQFYASPEDISAAKASIAEGGEYSVDAVAGRIMDMAKALSGGDASKITELRTAVQKGFKAAGVDFGRKMPDITNQTYNEVMKRFDDWEKETKGLSENAAAIGAE